MTHTRRLLPLCVLLALLAAVLSVNHTQAGATSAPASAPARTALLGAFGPEVTELQGKLVNKRAEDVHGMKFYLGTLNGREVVLAETGIGKVNAAMTTTLMIDRYHPSELIFSGIAGGVSDRVKPGDIVIGDKVGQHDFGFVSDDGMRIDELVSPTDGKAHPKLMPCDARLLALAVAAGTKATFSAIRTSQGERAPQVLTGTIATGDVFVASGKKKAELIKQLAADAVEMEGGAVVQVARQLKTPVLVVRSISDMADATAQLDIKQFFAIAAHNSASLVATLVESLALPAPATQPAP